MKKVSGLQLHWEQQAERDERPLSITAPVGVLHHIGLVSLVDAARNMLMQLQVLRNSTRDLQTQRDTTVTPAIRKYCDL